MFHVEHFLIRGDDDFWQLHGGAWCDNAKKPARELAPPMFHVEHHPTF